MRPHGRARLPGCSRPFYLVLVLACHVAPAPVAASSSPTPTPAPSPPLSSFENLGFGFSILGCPCFATCARTVDSPLTPWCYTSEAPYVAPVAGNSSGPAAAGPCGLGFSSTRDAYWDFCTVNTTGTAPAVAVQLTSFADMWTVMTTAAVATLAAVYLAAGCTAAALAAGWPPAFDGGRGLIVWAVLPGIAALAGSCHGLLVGAVLAALLSLLYLSIPYAIDLRLAIAVGVGAAALLGFGALGRHARKAGVGEAPLHASEIE